MNESVKYTAILVFISFLWGAAYPVMKIAIGGVGASPTLVMGGRFLAASLLLMAIFPRRFFANYKKEMIRPVFIVSLALFLDFIFYSVGLKFTTATNSGFITGVSVIFVPFVMLALDKTPLKLKDLAPLFVTLVGVYFLGSNSGVIALNKGDLLTMMSPLMFAFYVVLLSRFSLGIDPVCFTVIQMACVGLMGLLASLIMDGLPVMSAYSPAALICWLILCVFGTALPFSLQNYAQPHSSPLAAAIIYSLMPLFSLVTSIIILGESLAWRGYLGGFLMVAAVILARIDPLKDRRQADPGTAPEAAADSALPPPKEAAK